jgi:hypothetical protein
MTLSTPICSMSETASGWSMKQPKMWSRNSCDGELEACSCDGGSGDGVVEEGRASFGAGVDVFFAPGEPPGFFEPGE